MPAAEIIAIGTELLLGEIQDTNTRFLARALRDAGVDLYRTTVVGDNTERIAGAIQEALQRAQIVITTGGLGPTVDDSTRQAVALAVGVPLEFQPRLWEQILSRFQRYGRQASDNNRRQAYIPTGAIPVENPVGTAPAFIVEGPEYAIASLPGVPREMEYLFQNNILPYLRQRFDLRGVIKAHVLHTSGIGESLVDELIGDLETSPNPTVGLLAHAGRVDVRVTAKASSDEQAERLMQEMLAEIRARLKDAIFGQDEETLPHSIGRTLVMRDQHLGLVECDLEGDLAAQLKDMLQPEGIFIVSMTCNNGSLRDQMERLRSETGIDLVLGASLERGSERQKLSLVLFQPSGEQESVRSYGGPPAMGTSWAVNTALDFLRRNL